MGGGKVCWDTHTQQGDALRMMVGLHQAGSLVWVGGRNKEKERRRPSTSLPRFLDLVTSLINSLNPPIRAHEKNRRCTAEARIQQTSNTSWRDVETAGTVRHWGLWFPKHSKR